MINLNTYIKKSHLKMVDKFNSELEAFAQETGEEVATLWEDAYTDFTLSNIRVENGCLCYNYDGNEECDQIVYQYEDTKEYYEEEYQGIVDTIKFYRACLRRAKRYWAMDCDTLDAIQSGEKDDIEEEEN